MIKKLMMVAVALCVFARCSEENIVPDDNFTPQMLVVTSNNQLTAVKPSACSKCTYMATNKPGAIDGQKQGIKPGDVICLDAAIQYAPLQFVNMTGTVDKPIVITTCGAKVTVQASGKSFGIRVSNSKFIKVNGGTSGYGLLVNGPQIGITFDYLTTEFEVDHIEVANAGFAGIMAKTDPTCEAATDRAHFTMRNISIHDNYIHHSGGEGIYVGNSYYNLGADTPCGKKMPHSIIGAKIYKNKIQYSGWDGIQVGSVISGAQIYNNSVQNYGTKGISAQNNGIQIGEGTGGLCYNNVIKYGTGHGMAVFGIGDNKVEDNIIVNPGQSGIFCDERYTPGSGFTFTENVIINPPLDGIQLYAEKVPMNYSIRNVVVNPGNYNKYEAEPSWLTGQDAYLHKLTQTLKVTKVSNVFKRNTSEVMDVYTPAMSYDPLSTATNPTSKIVALVDKLNL